MSVDGQVPYVAFNATERLQLARVSGTEVQLTTVAEAGDDPFQVVSLAVDARSSMMDC